MRIRHCYMDLEDYKGTGLKPGDGEPIPGHQREFEVDIRREKKFRALLPSSLPASYWDICPAHKEKLFGYTPEQYVRERLRLGGLDEVDLDRVGLDPEDFV